jgi:hypothetical protein
MSMNKSAVEPDSQEEAASSAHLVGWVAAY